MFKVFGNLINVLLIIVSIGVVIGALVTGQIGFAMFYFFFALFLIVIFKW